MSVDLSRRIGALRYARALVLAAAALVVLAAGCKTRTAQPAPTRVDEGAARIAQLQEEEGHVLARRDELKRERQQVDADRAALEERRRQVAQSGGDPKPLELEATALQARETKLLVEEARLGRELDGLLRGYQQVTVGAQGKDVTAREAQVALRERDFGRREASLADREAQLAVRERELARRQREECAAPAAAPPPAPAAAARYTRKDVEPLLTSSRRKMSERGLLSTDLPSPARSLEREALEAMSAGDFARARFAADQLVATVDSLPIDKGFIMAKIARLNGEVKAAKLPEDARKQVDELFRDATADYGDGKFVAANGKLNRIYGLLR